MSPGHNTDPCSQHNSRELTPDGIFEFFAERAQGSNGGVVQQTGENAPIVVDAGADAGTAASSSTAESAVASPAAGVAGAASVSMSVGAASVGAAASVPEGSTGSVLPSSFTITVVQSAFVHVSRVQTPASHTVISVVGSPSPWLVAAAEPPEPLPEVVTEVVGGVPPPEDADADEDDVKVLPPHEE